MNSLPLSLSSPRSGMGRRWRTRCTPPPTRSCRLPQMASSSTQAVDVDGAEGAEGETLRTAAAVGDEIDLEEPGAGVIPLREGADGDLVAEPGPHPRGGGPARGPGGPRGGEQPAEGGRTHVADELVELGGARELAVAGEPVEELGDEGMEAMRANVSGGLPQDLHRRGHGGAVEARAAGARAGRGRPRRPPEQADRRLAVQTGDSH